MIAAVTLITEAPAWIFEREPKEYERHSTAAWVAITIEP